jgi:hypothetical protein
LGTSSGFAINPVSGLAARGFLMHEGKPEATAQRIWQFPHLLEIICSSAGGSLLYFEHAGGRVQGIFQEPDASSEQQRQIATCHDGIVAFADDFAKARSELQLGDDIAPAIAAEALFRVIGNPTKEEAVRLGGLTLSDNAGSMNRRACAQFRASNECASLLEDYRKAFWQAGLLAQPNLQAATLRTLLWLMQE